MGNPQTQLTISDEGLNKCQGNSVWNLQMGLAPSKSLWLPNSTIQVTPARSHTELYSPHAGLPHWQHNRGEHPAHRATHLHGNCCNSSREVIVGWWPGLEGRNKHTPGRLHPSTSLQWECGCSAQQQKAEVGCAQTTSQIITVWAPST